jgi:hypothetical protein
MLYSYLLKNGIDQPRSKFLALVGSYYKFILVVIAIFSKYVWLRPLKDKKGESVSKALKDDLAEGKVT